MATSLEQSFIMSPSLSKRKVFYHLSVGHYNQAEEHKVFVMEQEESTALICFLLKMTAILRFSSVRFTLHKHERIKEQQHIQRTLRKTWKVVLEKNQTNQ